MRRDEFEVKNEDIIKEILGECEHGVLSLISESKPYGVALNFVFFDGKLCFHGAKSGKKIKAIKENKNASFLAVQEYSLIPSYFSDPSLACPATQFFSSVHAEGEVKFVESVEEKALIMSAFMEKLQQEGGYEPIVANEMYTKMLKAISVFVLTPKVMSLKVKVGQNLSDEKFASFIKKLEARAYDKDIETIKAMKQFR